MTRPIKTILGIDPGSQITGFGIIRSNGIRHAYITSGCIRITGKDIATKMQQIYDGISEVIRNYQPEEAAVEQVFMHKNPSSAIKLGQARGAAIVVAAIHTLSVAEYSAREIKKTVVGYGAAKKEQIQHMVKSILKLSGLPQADAADALAVAICHAQFSSQMIERGGKEHVIARSKALLQSCDVPTIKLMELK